MSVKIEWHCDRCGADISDTNRDLFRLQFRHDDPDEYVIDSFDLCRDCFLYVRVAATTPPPKGRGTM
jgi:hypothetical protein